MKKKFSDQALMGEWDKYRKWYEKQSNKGLSLSGRSEIIASSFDEYMFYRDKISEGFTKSGDVLAEMKRLSFNVSRRQIEHLCGEVDNFIRTANPDEVSSFLARFGAEIPMDGDKVDVERVVMDTIHNRIEPLVMQTGKNHGWYGTLSDMMEYIETLGYAVSWNS